MEYCGKYNLKNHSTLKIGPVNAKVVYIDKKEDILEALLLAEKEGLIPYPLGGGSNTIFSDSVIDKYLFLIPRMNNLSVAPSLMSSSLYSAGIQVNSNDSINTHPDLDPREYPRMTENTVHVKISAGLEWDKAVKQTVEMGLSGLEALSYIPGLVGTSPVQNIGAYGSEVKDTIHTVHTYDIREKKFVDFQNSECEFEYRNSIFKNSPGRYFIYAVTFSLLNTTLTKARPWFYSPVKTLPSVPQYKDVISHFEQKNIISPTLKEIREAIISIRKAKLPNHKETPNAGSYFGNPIISKEKAKALLQKFPEMPMFPYVIPAKAGIQSDKSIKLFAGWLIDKAGLKGYEKENFSIHKDHALVIIGNGKGDLPELFEFESYIKQKVFEMFGVELIREPVVVE